jgi:hypothetical protein
MTQVPVGALIVTSPLEALTVQPDVEDPSTLYVTGLPDAPPVAVTVYVDPTGADVGGVLVKVITCESFTKAPASVAVAGAPSAELTFALFENGPGVDDVVTGIEIAGSVVPGEIGSAPV